MKKQIELLEWEKSHDIKATDILSILENGIWVVVDTFYMRSYRYYYVSPEEIIIDLQNNEMFILETAKSEHWGEADYITKKTSLDIYEMGEKWFLTEEEVKKFTEEKYQEMMKQQKEKKKLL